MSDKKHIDRIFQEKLKDFEVSPNPELWGKIQNELNLEKEEPKKVIPIWMRIASIAALLAILITIGSFVFDGGSNNLTPDSNTVDTNADSNNPIIDELDNNPLNNNTENKVANDDQINEPNNASLENTSEQGSSHVVLSETENKPKSQSEMVSSPSNFSSNNNDIAESNKSEKEPSDYNNIEKQNLSNSKSSRLNKDNFTNSIESSVAQTDTSNSDKLDDNSNGMDNKNDSSSKESSNKKSKLSNSLINTESQATQVTDNLNNNASKSTDKPLHKNNVSSNTSVANSTVSPSNSNAEIDKQAVDNALGIEKTQEAVALNAMKGDTPHNEKEKEVNQKVGDSLATSESPSIEEEIAQAENINEKEEEEEKLVNRWQVAASVAPVYYNSLGNGSHIDDQFVSNSKSGEVNMSYGVNVSYALSKKLSVRSGVNSLNLSYDTDNVILYETPSGNNGTPINPLRNINLAPQSQSLNAFSADNLGVQQINDVLYNAAISQRLSYYEVPVELEYKLVNNRFGLNVIGGVSTFFLDGNEVYSEFEEYNTYIGEANNINNVSFSTNLGIGINYKFTESFKFNFEPTFKYQLNGFENTSGNFRPYIIGVYTGFSYKF
ncbi:hypothetical protein [Hanstruepera ponticola]|uniref:hypothetical protein n=1 Tax=Hanstruepera ponticola TaxID=2042995 RepID=UPI00177D6228|nr:hypothetical protein [Hanstruepera ponticola]